MKIVILDYMTLGKDLDISGASRYGEFVKYEKTSQEDVESRISDADIIIVNKVKMTPDVLRCAKNLKLICETATGYDNIDLNYCSEHGIAVCNVPAYSSNNVTQLTVSTVLSLITHLSEYNEYVSSGKYSEGQNANCLVPIYHEIAGLTWGIIGYGNIGKCVGKVAQSLGCNVIVNKKTPEKSVQCVDIDTLLSKSDIISIHCPLNKETENLIDSHAISLMKDGVIIVNAARGKIWDESAVCDAVISGKIGGLGCDVYSIEPFPSSHPFTSIMGLKNVILTPHMAWGSYEARKRCFDTVLSNIDSFLSGKNQNRIC